MEISQQPHQLPKGQGGKTWRQCTQDLIQYLFFPPPKTNHPQPVMNVPPFPFLSNYRQHRIVLPGNTAQIRRG